MPIFISMLGTRILDDNWQITGTGSIANGAATVTLIAHPYHSLHILEIIAGYSSATASGAMTITGTGVSKTYTVKGQSGANQLVDLPYPANTPLTVTLAAGGAGVQAFIMVAYSYR